MEFSYYRAYGSGADPGLWIAFLTPVPHAGGSLLSEERPRGFTANRPRSLPKKGVGRLPAYRQVLGSQPAGDVSHKPGGRLTLLSARPAVTPATLKRAATSLAAW